MNQPPTDDPGKGVPPQQAFPQHGPPPQGYPGAGQLPMNMERTPAGYFPCPSCGSHNVIRPSFTWWGGFVGQYLISHVRCSDCGHGYNGKTGGPNTVAIIIYSVVLGAIALGLVLFGY